MNFLTMKEVAPTNYKRSKTVVTRAMIERAELLAEK